jgi:dolichyl-phosphate beta-glucosyltransferase
MDARRNQRIDAPEIAGRGPAVDVQVSGGASTGLRGPGRRRQPKTGRLTSDCVVVIPCFNEERRLNADAIREFLLDHENIGFLLVNDGSTDLTRELLDEMVLGNPERLSVLHLKRNSGKAEAVRLGLLEAAERGVRYAGFWDADLATPLNAIPEFVLHLDDHPEVQMIFGARVRLLGRQIERRPLRHYLGRVFATVASLVLGVPLYDTQCGAKLFRVSPEIVRLFQTPFRSRWIFDVEIVARFLCEPHSVGINSLIHEKPLELWRDVAGSKVRPRDFLRAAFELWTIGRSYRHRRAAPIVPAPVSHDAAEVLAS